MADLSMLIQEIEALERVQADLAGIASRDDDARRADLVELRRKLSAQIGKVGTVAEPLLAKLGDPALLETYRLKYSAMRSAAAAHQAKWPAVLLGERPDEYRASAEVVRNANKEFVGWMRETIKLVRDRG
jgi:hypothetical protein